jgi:hypothetical protein
MARRKLLAAGTVLLSLATLVWACGPLFPAGIPSQPR